MQIAIKIQAPNSRNGNACRGWLVYEVTDQAGRIGECADSDLLGFVDEGCMGIGALRRAYPRAHVILEIPVDKKTYRAHRRAK